MKYFFFPLVLLSLAITGCETEQNKKLLGAYFKYSVNGAPQAEINDGSGLNNNIFDCDFQGDTALYINVSKLYEGAGFVVKSNSITDGVYTLDNTNRAYYTNPADRKRYYTSSHAKGTLTIKRSTFQAKTPMNTLEGTFSFQATDTATGKTFSISNGSFLMERKLQ
jgi:hypothetical protein